MTDTQQERDITEFRTWWNSQPHRAKYGPADLAYLTAWEAWSHQAAERAKVAEGGEALSNNYIQNVPDKCDRILWRKRYYSLDLLHPAQPADQSSREQALEGLSQTSAALGGYEVAEPVAEDVVRDAERFRWLCEDHPSKSVRLIRRAILGSMEMRSYANACAAIDAAIAKEKAK